MTPSEKTTQKILVIIASETLGKGDDTLGKKLISNYIKSLDEMGEDLWQIILLNGGVKLTTADSPVLEELKAFQAQGINVLACGTCLQHFHLQEQKMVGETTNMLDIVSATLLADKVITLC